MSDRMQSDRGSGIYESVGKFSRKTWVPAKSGGLALICRMGTMFYSEVFLGQFSISRISLGYFPPEHACPCKCSQSLQPIILMAELSICQGLKEVGRVPFVGVAILITTPKSFLWVCYLIRLKLFYQLFLHGSQQLHLQKNWQELSLIIEC